jgi:Plant PDR ABC transporter associated
LFLVNTFHQELFTRKLNKYPLLLQEFHYGNMKADTVGKAVLESRGLFMAWHWFWFSAAALFGFSLIFNILSVFALEILNRMYLFFLFSHCTYLCIYLITLACLEFVLFI